jgi:hypothetical protein
LIPVPVADKVVLALKGTPMLLAMMVTNLAVFAMVTYLTMQAAELRQNERGELIKALKECLERKT